MKRRTLIFLCVLLFLAAVGGGFLTMRFAPRGVYNSAGADETAAGYLRTASRETLREEFCRTFSCEVTPFEDRETLAASLFDHLAVGEWHFRAWPDSPTEDTYLLSCGDADFLTLTLVRSNGAWQIGSVRAADTLTLTPRTLSVTVPSDAAVTVNGVLLGEEYMAERSLPYDGLNAREAASPFTPCRVRYEIPGIYGSVEVAAEREGGVLLLRSDGTVWDYTVPDARSYSFLVRAPADAAVYADGMALTDGVTSPLPTRLRVPEELVPLFPQETVYAEGGLYRLPELTAEANGTALAAQTDAQDGTVFSSPGSEALHEECGNRVEAFLRELTQFSAANTAIGYPDGYVSSASGLQRSFTRIRPGLHWMSGVVITFREVSTDCYLPLGENAFYCRGHILCTTETRYQTRELTMDSEMLWVREGESWYIYDFANL